jgi:hypothetical protein
MLTAPRRPHIAENDTLVYGSNDYGQHVWAKNERFNKIMAVAGRKLKLKGTVMPLETRPRNLVAAVSYFFP